MRRLMSLGGTLALAGLGACSGASSSAAVSVANLSDASVRVEAELNTGLDGGARTVGQVDLAPGTSGGFRLTPPEGGHDRGVAFEVRPLAGGAPTSLTMSPPGPYLLRISGPGSGLTLERELVEAAGRDRDLGVPPDPAGRTWGGAVRP
ncbi:MAG: hypothetical protein ACIARR_10870 [Phycisphaerales bacterium JB059]